MIPTTKTISIQGILLLALAQTMVGLNIVFSKLVVEHAPVLNILTIRFAFAAIILLPLHWLTKDRHMSLASYIKMLNQRDWVFIAAQGMTAGFLFNLLMLIGLDHTDANVAGIITSALPAIIATMSWLFLKERLTPKTCLCILLATIGLVIIASSKVQGVGEQHSFYGDLIVLISLLPEAAYYVLCKIYKNRLPIFLASSLLNFIVAIAFFVILLLLGQVNIAISAKDWLILVLLGLSSGLFYVFWLFGSRNVDTMIASISTAIMPVAAVLAAWAILGEQLVFAEFVGMVLIIGSIIVNAKR